VASSTHPDRVAALAVLALLALTSCGDTPAREDSKKDTKPSVMGVARLQPRNGSTVRGLISFTQKGDKVAVAGEFFELTPGSHSLYIHEVGNCSSRNAASAGPVWNLAGNTGRRTGALPDVFAAPSGRAQVVVSLPTISVATGRPDDVIGHAVVLYADVDPDPRAEFGVPNNRLACGVVEPSTGVDLKDLL
jgi:Cu-Zn family superoxide dismutase